MAYRLVELIRASGFAGIVGQSFRWHVTGAASGASMRQYLILSWSISGVPSNPLPVYNDNSTVTLTVTFNRGARAYHIQRNTSAAWSISASAAAPGAAASIVSVTAGGSPLGETHTVGLRVRGCYSGSPTISVAGFQSASTQPANAFTDPWPASWQSITGASTPTGQSEITVELQYSPDIGGFNPNFVYSFPMTVFNRAVEMDTEWHANSSYTSLVSASANFDLLNSALYPSTPAGLLPGESITLYLRYRTKGTTTWTNHGPVTCFDGR